MYHSLYLKCVVLVLWLNFVDILSECFVLNSQFTTNKSDALYLTSFIEKGQISEARLASEVTELPGIGNAFKSYSGYFTVNKAYNSNMFFWFFPPLNGDPNCSVLLWLEGGPGLSTLIGVFAENGPIQVDVNGTPSLRNITLNHDFAMLYIDNPVGTGFSFTDNDAGYSRNQDDISTNLYSFLQQFFFVFSEYRENPFFLTGYSYGCKYIVTLANLIHKENHHPDTDQKINLRGLTIGDGFCDLRLESNWANYLLQVGLIDQNEWNNFTAQQTQLQNLIEAKQYLDAYNAVDRLILGYTGRSHLRNVTGQAAVSILRDPTDYQSIYNYRQYVERSETRSAIHVGTRPLNNVTRVLEALEADMPQSVSPAIEYILNRNYPTLFYNGNMDIVINTANIENLLLHLDWNGASKFKQATQHIYRVNNQTVAGYVRQADNLYYMVVRNSGHIVQFDQPVVAHDMVTRFVRTFEKYTNCEANKTDLFV